MGEDRDHYFRVLGFAENDKNKLERALTRAYQLRDFEIELYWKRATYFWGFQLAIFAAFGLLWKATNSQTPDDWGPITLALASLGVLTAFANYLSARGSRFWQNNWEKHIDLLEDEIEGRLYKTVWLNEKRPGYSVTRINQTLGVFLVVFWILVIVYAVWNFLGLASIDWQIAYAVLVLSGTAFGAFWLICQRSEFSGTIPADDGNHGIPLKSGSCWRKSNGPSKGDYPIPSLAHFIRR